MPTPSDTYSPLTYRYFSFCAGSILFLICLGGVVTSEKAGMSVPDYPTSYGYNMFLFPWQDWVGGIFWEHSHRLVASGVGVFIIGLTVLSWFQKRSFIWTMGWVALVLVISQGLLGGARVYFALDWVGIPHALMSQAFFAEVALMALFCSKWWLDPETAQGFSLPKHFCRWVLVVTCLIYVQLGLGATMRHQHTDLSIPDFPTAYGLPWPKVDPASMTVYNKQRLSMGLEPTTAVQIHLQMTHRVTAVLILLGIVTTLVRLLRSGKVPSMILGTAIIWTVLVLVQFTLGMYVIWTNKAADVATAHVAVGALTFITGVMLVAQSWRVAVASSKLPAESPRTSPQLEPAAA